MSFASALNILRPMLPYYLALTMYGLLRLTKNSFESTFSAVERMFRDSVRSKTDMVMANEVLCHNLTCLIQEQETLGIMPVFWKDEAGEKPDVLPLMQTGQHGAVSWRSLGWTNHLSGGPRRRALPAFVRRGFSNPSVTPTAPTAVPRWRLWCRLVFGLFLSPWNVAERSIQVKSFALERFAILRRVRFGEVPALLLRRARYCLVQVSHFALACYRPGNPWGRRRTASEGTDRDTLATRGTSWCAANWIGSWPVSRLCSDWT